MNKNKIIYINSANIFRCKYGLNGRNQRFELIFASNEVNICIKHIY